MLGCIDRGQFDAATGVPMRVKAIAVLVIVAVSAGAFLAMRRENRADAAGGNCYAAPQGPSTPQICD